MVDRKRRNDEAGKQLREWSGRLLRLILLSCVAGCADGRPGWEKVEIDGETFELELAIDDSSRTQGMMSRQSIPDAEGMLFVFPEAEVLAFWMGNCLVDIDIIFLDPHGRVTATHRMRAELPRRDDESEAQYDARMPRYESGHRAQFAIELKGGTLDRLPLRVEDKIELDLERLKGLAQ